MRERGFCVLYWKKLFKKLPRKIILVFLIIITKEEKISVLNDKLKKINYLIKYNGKKIRHIWQSVTTPHMGIIMITILNKLKIFTDIPSHFLMILEYNINIWLSMN